MSREIIRGPNYRISVELTYLPQATVQWWKELIRLTKGSFERPDWMKMLLNYIQSPEAEEAYIKLIPSGENNKILYRKVHGERCTIPSKGQLTLFEKRLPKIVKLLEDELNKYDMEELNHG